MSDDGHIFSSFDEAHAAGMITYLLGAPFVVSPGRKYSSSIYIATISLRLGRPDGSVRDLAPGDLLYADEALHGTAIAAMTGRGDVVELPADRGVARLLALCKHEVGRLERYEQMVALLALDDDELVERALAVGLVKVPGSEPGSLGVGFAFSAAS